MVIATSRNSNRSKVGSALIREAARKSPRACARGRRMRATDQGLWRYACARACQLPRHRDARDPAGAGRRDCAGAGVSMRSPTRAPRRLSIRKARASPNAALRAAMRIAAGRAIAFTCAIRSASIRHARACRGHPASRARHCVPSEMAGTSPAMTLAASAQNDKAHP